MATWKPSTIQPATVLNLVRWGFPLTCFSNFLVFDKLCKELGDSLASSGKPDRKSYSELSAAALVMSLGATAAERVPEGNTPTPDWMIWWDENCIELEVTRAEEKPAHILRRNQAADIAAQLRALNRPWDIVVFVVDLLDKSEIRAILEAGRSTVPGAGAIEQNGKWHLYSERPDRAVDVVLIGGLTDQPPGRWPSTSHATCWVFNQYLAGPETTSPPPQIRVRFGVPVTGYVNPAQNKEASFQGSGEAPFVLALDVIELPGVHATFRRELPGWLQTWTRFSGVLAFQGPMIIGKKIGWIWDFIPNHYAIHPLPEAIPRHIPNDESKETSAWLFDAPTAAGTDK